MPPVIPVLILSALSTQARAAEGDEPFLPMPKPYGLVQVWATAYDMDSSKVADPAGYGDPEDDPGFKIRRARVGFRGQDDHLRYGLVLGVGAAYDALSSQSEEAGIIDAYGGFHAVKPLWVDVGLTKVPVGRENLISSSGLVLSERSVAEEWMLPGREVGVVADAALGEEELSGRLRVGLFNGNGALFGDTDAGKLVSARLEGTLGPGNTYKTFGSVQGFTLGVAGDFWMDQDQATTTVGYGGDLMLRVAGLAVLGELHLATITPTRTDVDVPGVLGKTPRMGLTGQVGYSIHRFEPAARFSMFDDHTGLDDNGNVAEATAGLTWHGPQDVVQAGAGYVMRLELAGQALDNDTARAWFQLKI